MSNFDIFEIYVQAALVFILAVLLGIAVAIRDRPSPQPRGESVTREVPYGGAILIPSR